MHAKLYKGVTLRSIVRGHQSLSLFHNDDEPADLRLCDGYRFDPENEPSSSALTSKAPVTQRREVSMTPPEKKFASLPRNITSSAQAARVGASQEAAPPGKSPGPIRSPPEKVAVQNV